MDGATRYIHIQCRTTLQSHMIYIEADIHCNIVRGVMECDNYVTHRPTQ